MIVNLAVAAFPLLSFKSPCGLPFLALVQPNALGAWRHTTTHFTNNCTRWRENSRQN